MLFIAPIEWLAYIAGFALVIFLFIAFPIPMLLITGLIVWAIFAGMKAKGGPGNE